MRKSGTQKSWMTSLEWTSNFTDSPAGRYSWALAKRRPPSLYANVQANCSPPDLDHALVARGGRLLDVAHHDVGVGDERDDEDRRGGGPDHLELRVAVDRRAVEVLLARSHPEVEHREADDHGHEHEDRDRRDEQDVPERVDRPCLRRSPRRGTSRSGGCRSIPRTEATRPTTTICVAVRFGSRRSAGATSCCSCGLSSRAMGAASYGSLAMDDNAVGAAPRRPVRPRRRVRRPARALRPRRRAATATSAVLVAGPAAERRGRHLMVAPEGLGELRGLAVADAVGDLADGQRRGRRASPRRAPCGRR